MKLAYVAGPYRAKTVSGIVQNIREAEAIAIELWKMGFAVLCPHTNTALMDGAMPDETFLEGTLEMMRRCDFVVLTPRWQASRGAIEEKAEAERRGMPIYLWPNVTEPL